jgi:hypothetical protein
MGCVRGALNPSCSYNYRDNFNIEPRTRVDQRRSDIHYIVHRPVSANRVAGKPAIHQRRSYRYTIQNAQSTHCAIACIRAIACISRFPLPHHELPSISAHFALISWFFSFAASRFALVRSSLCARRHLLTCVFAPLHMPTAFHMKPRAWHSSRIVMTSSQAVGG